MLVIDAGAGPVDAEANTMTTDKLIEMTEEAEIIGALRAALRGEVIDRLHLDSPIFGEDFTFLKTITGEVPKLTIPSPRSISTFAGGKLAS